jgi:pimeloyl-ACP methyl ester carboxylesterase
LQVDWQEKMSKPKPSRKERNLPAARTAMRAPSTAGNVPASPTVSARWLLSGFAIAIAAALVFAWTTLCILFWQGSWQLLYHPASAISRTPASANLPFDSVGFATTASDEPQLRGWWIPASSQARFTAIYLHGANGNLGDTVDALAQIHSAGINLFALDYRGYGQSHFVHPSETSLREDADAAIHYLVDTRHIAQSAIILFGNGLGANLALEAAAAHPGLAGVVLDQPLDTPTAAIFKDARSRLVPARLLVRDRWDANTAASNLLIPSLWFNRSSGGTDDSAVLQMYQKVPARKTLVWLTNSPNESKHFSEAFARWLDELPVATR